MYISVTGNITDVGICEAVIVAYSTAVCRDCVSGGYGGTFCCFGCFADSSGNGNKENKDKQRLRKA